MALLSFLGQAVKKCPHCMLPLSVGTSGEERDGVCATRCPPSSTQLQVAQELEACSSLGMGSAGAGHRNNNYRPKRCTRASQTRSLCKRQHGLFFYVMLVKAKVTHPCTLSRMTMVGRWWWPADVVVHVRVLLVPGAEHKCHHARRQYI